MLGEETVNAAVPLAMLAARKDMRLIPIQNTPLAALVGSCYDMAPECAKTVSSQPISAVGLVIGASGDKEMNGTVLPNCRSDVLDNTVDVISKAVREQIGFAKTVVSPIIQDIVDKARGAIENQRTSSPTLAAYGVDTFAYPKMFFNNSFIDLVSGYHEGNFNRRVNCSVVMPEQKADELQALIMTGSKVIDEDIKEWLAIKGNEFLGDVWRSFFAGSKPVGMYDTSIADVMAKTDVWHPGITTQDISAAVFLLANKLIDNPLEGTEMSLQDMNSYLSAYREVASNFMAVDQDDIKVQIDLGTVIRTTTRKTVIVNEHIYTDWLKDEKNCVEQLLGALIKAPGEPYCASALETDRAVLIDAWESFVRTVKTTDALSETETIRRLLVNYFNEYSAGIVANHPELAANQFAANKRFEAEIYKFTIDEVKEMWHATTKAVCRAAFPATNAEEILIGIEEASKATGCNNPREAATYVVIQLVSKWVASQIGVAS